jgi:hypothetical protein
MYDYCLGGDLDRSELDRRRVQAAANDRDRRADGKSGDARGECRVGRLVMRSVPRRDELMRGQTLPWPCRRQDGEEHVIAVNRAAIAARLGATASLFDDCFEIHRSQ